MADPCSVYADILQRVPIGIFTVDRHWKLSFWNGRLSEWTGIRAEEALGRPLGEVLPRFVEAHNLSRLGLVMDGGPPVVFSWQLHHDLFPISRRRRGAEEARYTVASSLRDGGILFSVEDYTEVTLLLREARTELGRRREVEAALQQALAAKETVIRESNHRIKNNLMMVTSLISIESDRAEDEVSRRFLSDLASRVSSIGLLHELLYSGPGEEDPRVDEYLEHLGETIVRSYRGEDGLARFSTDIEPIRLSARVAIKVGMIFVEVVTNALKYAGSAERAPRIAVRFSRRASGFELLVEDDGPGMPPPSAVRRDSLGLLLLDSFAGELGGTVEFLPGPGARVRVAFPDPASRRV